MSIFLSTLMIKRKPGLVMYILQEPAQRTARGSSRNIGPMHEETLLLAQPRRREVGFGFYRVARGISLRL